MIIASFVLVVVAIGLLVAGILLPQMLFIYVSIGLSALAALLLGAGAFRRRDELVRAEQEREPAAAAREREPAASRSGAAASSGGWPTRAPQPASARAPQQASAGSAGAGSAGAGAAGAATATWSAEPTSDVPDDAQVWVVPGWRKYHLPGCRQLRRQQAEEISYAEATEQGYTMCASCMPDTALAARGRGDDSGPRVDSESVTSPPETDHESSGSGEAQPSGSAGATEAETTAAPEAEAATEAETTGESEAATESEAAGQTSVSTRERPDTDEGEETADREQPETEEGEATSDQVGMVSGGRRFHRLDCAVVEDATQDGVELTTMSRNEAEATDAVPCTVCRP